MTVNILVGDCRQTLAQLAAGRFYTCVTSPPYHGLRDYGTPPLEWPAISYAPMPGLPECVHVPAMTCSLGLEPTLEAFIGHQLLVFRQVRRVLRDDGTLWVNMGDNYAGSRAGGHQDGTLEGSQPVHAKLAKKHMTASRRRDDEPIPRNDLRIKGLKPKDLVGQPWRLAFALQADGWWLRMDVIWEKPNPMPESTKDRPTKAHEYIFLLSKSERYYYDADAIKEPASADTHARYARGRSTDHKHAQAELVPGQRPQTIAQGFEHMRKPVAGWQNGAGSHTAIEHTTAAAERGQLLATASPKYQGDPAAHRTKTGLAAAERAARPRKVLPETQAKLGAYRDQQRLGEKAQQEGNDSAYAEGAGARMGRGAGWRNDPANLVSDRNKRSVWTVTTEGFPGAHFATFPTKLIEPCILAGCPVGGEVLDCFGGSGTVGLVADRHQRNAVLCELNPAYADLAQGRVTKDAPLFADVATGEGASV